MKNGKLLSGIAIIMVAGGILVACNKSNSYNNGGSSNSNSPTITMKGSVYSNTNLQVSSGTTVKWNNNDTIVHTVTADNGSFNSGDIQPGATFSQTFNAVGTIAYHDANHATMTGIIVVVANK